MERRVLQEEIDAFVDRQRARCLWFLRGDWYPSDDAERLRVLEQIQKH